MKIALFHNLPSGGAKRTVFEQAAWLSKEHTIDLFSLSTADSDFLDPGKFISHKVILPFQTCRLLKSPFGRLNMVIRMRDLYRLERVMRDTAERIDQGGYDLALVHPCLVSFSPPLLKYLETPSLYYRHDVVRWVHDPPIERPYDRGFLNSKLDRFDPLIKIYRHYLIHNDRTSMQAAERCLVNSCFVRESLLRAYGIAARVCYQGVDENVFRPLEVEREKFVLSVGMIHRYKGYDFLIRSIGCIQAAERPDLVIVGNQTDPNEKRYLETLASQLAVKTIFKEMIDVQELISLYNRARCVAYTPHMESFGLVPLEAMACGTPVVGVREGGVRETILDGQTGYLVERDEKEFAEALSQLRDQNKVKQMGKRARDHILKYWTYSDAIRSLETEIEATKNRATF